MMKIGPVVAAAAVFAIASPVCAQDAVQWRVQDGGNGHWYRIVVVTPGSSWTSASTAATAANGYLASVRSSTEANFVKSLSNNTVGAFTSNPGGNEVGPWLGGARILGTNGWRWTSGESWNYTQWCAGEPNGGSGEPYVHLMRNGAAQCWNDRENNAFGSGNPSYIVEWSADCNSDGIVDYGQIRDGTFPDVNANGVPDCCEPGESCSPCPGDVTNGGTVDAADLSILLAAWGTNGQGEFDTDLNGDGLVDGGDLALVLGGWGACP